MYDKLLLKILGDDYGKGREIGIKILSYIAEHPDWNTSGVGYMQALDEAIVNETGHPISFYASCGQRREYVDVRVIAMLILRKYTRLTLNEIGKMFNRHHTTVGLEIKSAYGIIDVDKSFKEKYRKIEQKFLERL